MLVLHAAWIPSDTARDGQLAVWGETAQRRRATRRRQPPAAAAKRPRPHPFAASLDEFQDALFDLVRAPPPPRRGGPPGALAASWPARGPRAPGGARRAGLAAPAPRRRHPAAAPRPARPWGGPLSAPPLVQADPAALAAFVPQVRA